MHVGAKGEEKGAKGATARLGMMEGKSVRTLAIEDGIGLLFLLPFQIFYISLSLTHVISFIHTHSLSLSFSLFIFLFKFVTGMEIRSE